MSILFDGSDDTYAGAVSNLGSNFTVCFWMYDTGTTNQYGTILTENTGTGIRFDGTTHKMDHYYAGHHEASTAAPSNAWVHQAVVVSGGATTFYQSGVSNGTATGATTFAPNRIGNDSANEIYKGRLARMYVWISKALSAAEILTAMSGLEDTLYPSLIRTGTRMYTPVTQAAGYLPEYTGSNIWQATGANQEGVAADDPFAFGSAASVGSTAILDTFLRADEGPPPGTTWGASLSGIFGSATEGSGLVVSGNGVVGLTVSKTNTAYWLTDQDRDQEVSVEFQALPNSGGSMILYLRLQSGLTSVFSAGYMAVAQFPSAGTVSVAVFRVSGGAATLLSQAFTTSFAVSDLFGFDASTTGSSTDLGVYRYSVSAAEWSLLGLVSDPAPVLSTGKVGLGIGKQSAVSGKGGNFRGGPKGGLTAGGGTGRSLWDKSGSFGGGALRWRLG